MAATTFEKAYCRTYQGVMRGAVLLLNWDEPRLLKGAGSVKRLPETVKANGHKSVLIVTDKGLMGLHLLDGLFAGLDAAGVNYAVYDGVQPNPTIDNIEEARQLYVNHACTAVIAFGGGSPMDCAKAAAARIARPNMTVQQMRGTLKILKKLPELYAVPTTAGTGSETTLAAVVSDPSTHEKYALQDPVLRPKYAVLDPELTVGLPPHITSTTGMDALTHAVEAYIGHSNTKGTASAARKATRMIFDNIVTAYEDGKNIEARGKMLEASYLAGVAFTRAYVGYVHAIAHNFGGMYGTPHGLANAVILPYVLDYYGESAYAPLAELAEVGGLPVAGLSVEEKAKAFIAKVRELNETMKIPAHLKGEEKDIPVIAKRAMKEGNPLYPVPKIFGYDDFVAVIRQVME